MVPCLVTVIRMYISTVYAYQQSPKYVMWLLTFCCILSISGCATVDMGEHDVSPEVQSEIEAPFAQIDVSIVDDEVVTMPLLNTLNDEGIEAEFVNSTECTYKPSGEAGAHISLDQYLQSDARVEADKCDIDFIIVVGKDYRNNETNLAVTIVDYHENEKSETLHIHSEGNVRGFLPAPVPYLSLFYFVSTPDTEGSAIDALAEAIEDKIEMENYERPVRILYLRSDNLPTIAKQFSKHEDALDSKDKDTEMSRYNPLYFYVQMNKEAAEEGNPFVHNPIGQLQLLLTSILATPAFIIFDAIGLPDQTTSPIATTVGDGQGELNAQWELYRLSKFQGTPDFKLLCKIAEQGDYHAQWELGYLHLHGLYGIRKDLVISVMWYSLVEDGGHNPPGVEDIRKKLTPEQLTVAEHLYESWEPGQCEREIFGTEPNNSN